MNAIRIALTGALLFLLTGCAATMSNGKTWGANATFSPGWERVGKAAWNSLVSPFTWGPAAGAALLQVGTWDRNLSRWAADKTPVFGSNRNADNWSDYLTYTSGALYGTTALLTPSGGTSGEWIADKTKGVLVGGAAAGLAAGGAELTKTLVRRERPDGEDNKSFPSSHATLASSFATLSARNMQSMELSTPAEVMADVGFGVVAGGAAWARVEARKHYASDVLAGIALGHFVSAFVNDAFLGNDRPPVVVPQIDVSKNGFFLGVTWNN